MSTIQLDDRLRAEYQKLWDTMAFDPGGREKCAATAKRILANKARYQKIGVVPWWFAGLIHMMESGGRFDRHMHNGDPLTARTVQVPAGRPKSGTPPFSFEESAKDAFEMKGLGQITDWDIPRVAYEAERYNGWGYRQYHEEDLSPYLWSKTNHNDGTGKYVADGKWNASAPSEAQCGVMPTLRILMELDPSIVLGGGKRRGSGVGEAIAVGTTAAGGAVATAPGTKDQPVSVQIGIGLAAFVGVIAIFVVFKMIWGRK